MGYIVHGVTKSQTRLKRLSTYGNGDPPSPTCRLNTGNMGLSQVQQLKELLGSLRKADLRSMWECVLGVVWRLLCFSSFFILIIVLPVFRIGLRDGRNLSL